MYKKQMQYPDLPTGFFVVKTGYPRNTKAGVLFNYELTSLEWNAEGEYIENIYEATVLLVIHDDVPFLEAISVSYPKINAESNPCEYLRMSNGKALKWMQDYFGQKAWDNAKKILGR